MSSCWVFHGWLCQVAECVKLLSVSRIIIIIIILFLAKWRRHAWLSTDVGLLCSASNLPKIFLYVHLRIPYIISLGLSLVLLPWTFPVVMIISKTPFLILWPKNNVCPPLIVANKVIFLVSMIRQSWLVTSSVHGIRIIRFGNHILVASKCPLNCLFTLKVHSD